MITNFKIGLTLLLGRLSLLVLPTNAPTDTDVIMTSVVFRHGARNPIVNVTNPTCSTCNYVLPEGLGELTVKGKQQGYQLGKWLRKRYATLLANGFLNKEVRVQSSDLDRVVMTAECLLAGMFPPQMDEMWERQLAWQPIPVHTLDYKIDNKLSNRQKCPKMSKAIDKWFGKVFNELASSPEGQLALEYMPIFEKYTDLDFKNETSVCVLADFLCALKDNELPLPVWVTDPMLQALQGGCARIAKIKVIPKLKRFFSGVLIQEINENMLRKAAGHSTTKLLIYGAHDYTLFLLLKSLDVWTDGMALPDFAAAIIFDLRKRNDRYGVTLAYKPTYTSDAVVNLKIPGCEMFCELAKFVELLQSVVVANDVWVNECNL